MGTSPFWESELSDVKTNTDMIEITSGSDNVNEAPSLVLIILLACVFGTIWSPENIKSKFLKHMGHNLCEHMMTTIHAIRLE